MGRVHRLCAERPSGGGASVMFSRTPTPACLDAQARFWARRPSPQGGGIRKRQDTPPHSRVAHRAGSCRTVAPVRGRRECRALKCTRSLACNRRKHTSKVTAGLPETPGIPRAAGFNGFLRGLPGEPGLLSPSPAVITANLIPASGYQDATTSPCAPTHSSDAPTRPPHP